MTKCVVFFLFLVGINAQSLTVEERLQNLSDKCDAISLAVGMLEISPRVEPEDLTPILEEMNRAFRESAHLTIDTFNDPVQTKRLDTIGMRYEGLVKKINKLDKKVSKKSRKPLRLARFFF